MLLDGVGRMSVQYMGHFLLLFDFFFYVNQRGRHCPLVSGQWALYFWKRHVDFSASVSLCSNSQSPIWANVNQAVVFTD